MKKLIVFFLLVVAGLFLNAFSYLQQNNLTAKEIIGKAEDQVRGTSSVAEVTIDVVRPAWTRTMSLKTWTKGDKYSMILITGPKKDEGTVFLKRAKEVWNWLPSIERVIKLPPSMMAQSWMGTDFTNDDLVKEASAVTDYTHTLLGDTVMAQRKCWKIQMIPLPQTAVVWSKVFVWVDKQDFLELRIEFYDEDNKLVNIMKASDIKKLGGRTLPGKMEMIPVEKKGQETILTYQSIVFDKPIDESFFTTENMKKVK